MKKNIIFGKGFILPSFFLNLLRDFIKFPGVIIGSIITLLFLGKNATATITSLEWIVLTIIVAIKYLTVQRFSNLDEEQSINYQFLFFILLDISIVFLMFMSNALTARTMAFSLFGIWITKAMITALYFYKALQSVEIQNTLKDFIQENEEQEEDH